MKSNAFMKYSVKNNMNYTQDGCGGGYGRAWSHYQINCNSDSNHEKFCFALRGQKWIYWGGKFFPWGGNCPPRYIVKKGTGLQYLWFFCVWRELTINISSTKSLAGTKGLLWALRLREPWNYIVSDHFASDAKTILDRASVYIWNVVIVSISATNSISGAAVRSSKWCAVYRIGFCNALIVM